MSFAYEPIANQSLCSQIIHKIFIIYSHISFNWFTICLHFGHTLFITDLYNVLKDKGKGYSKESAKGV